ncbi:MAG: hypothetical protein HC888_17680 [Candidatus Competibacteraceae bacterium]|nr:hypothetical protein [Candidatus Competibacteraceae bacterium]
MENEKTEHVDFLVSGEDDGMPSVALSTRDICLQWSGLPPGALREMEAMISNPCGGSRELRVGQVFGVPLYFAEREGIFSFKAVTVGAGADLLRIDLTPAVVVGLLDTLVDVIEVWDD